MLGRNEIVVRVAAAFSLLVVLAACGDGESASSAPGALTDGKLVALKEEISGTAPQHSASGFLGNYAEEAPVKECMDAKKLPYEISYLDEAIGKKTLGMGTSWAYPLMDETVLWNLQVHAQQYPQFLAADETPSNHAIESSEKYLGALDACSKQEGNWEKAAVPADPEHVSYQFFELIRSVEDEIGSVGMYDKCMAEIGYDVKFDDFSGAAGLYQLLWSRAPDWADIPAIGDSGGSAWNAYRAWAMKVLQADESCRETKHAEAMHQLAPLIEQFERDNSEAIAQLSDQWRAMVEEATAKGWKDTTDQYTASE
jgi:hypothetical protein